MSPLSADAIMIDPAPPTEGTAPDLVTCKWRRYSGRGLSLAPPSLLAEPPPLLASSSACSSAKLPAAWLYLQRSPNLHLPAAKLRHGWMRPGGRGNHEVTNALDFRSVHAGLDRALAAVNPLVEPALVVPPSPCGAFVTVCVRCFGRRCTRPPGVLDVASRAVKSAESDGMRV